MDDQEHCIAKIRDLVASGEPTSRAILQIGYNLGRLSELTGQGREPFWDRWKDPLLTWNLPRLQSLAQGLQSQGNTPPDVTTSPPI